MARTNKISGAVLIADNVYLVPLEHGIGLGTLRSESNGEKRFDYHGYHFNVESALLGYLRLVEENALIGLRESDTTTIESLVETLSCEWKRACEDVKQSLARIGDSKHERAQ